MIPPESTTVPSRSKRTTGKRTAPIVVRRSSPARHSQKQRDRSEPGTARTRCRGRPGRRAPRARAAARSRRRSPPLRLPPRCRFALGLRRRAGPARSGTSRRRGRRSPRRRASFGTSPGASWKSREDDCGAGGGQPQPAEAVDPGEHPHAAPHCRRGRPRPGEHGERSRLAWARLRRHRRGRGRGSQRSVSPPRSWSSSSSEPAEHLAAAGARAQTAREPLSRRRERRSRWRRTASTAAERKYRAACEHQPPRRPGGEQERAGGRADTAGERPAGHVPFAPARARESISVACERPTKVPEAGSSTASAARKTRNDVRRRERGGAERERDPAPDDDPPPQAAVGQYPERGLEQERDRPRQRERYPDLEIAQPERVPDLRPGGLAGAVEQLVEELDGEEDGDETGGAPPAPAAGGVP